MDKHVDRQTQPLRELLDRLYRVTSDIPRTRDTIVVADQEPAMRGAIARILRGEFPGYEFVLMDTDEVVSFISAQLKDRVSMVITEAAGSVAKADDRAAEEGGVCSPDSGILDFAERLTAARQEPSVFPGLKKVPLVMTFVNFQDISPKNRDSLVDERGINAIVEKPFTAEGLKNAVRDAILRQLEQFNPSEAAIRIKVVKDFAARYKSLIPVLIQNIKRLSYFLEDEEDRMAVMDESSIEFITLEALCGLEKVLGLVLKLKEIDEDTTSNELGKIFHDMNNKLAYIYADTQYALEHVKSGEDIAILTALRADMMKLAGEIKLLTSANRKRGGVTWSTIQLNIDESLIHEELKIPQGMRFCVIDDDTPLSGSLVRTIVSAGGKEFAACDRDSLASLLEAVKREGGGIDVFLLDHSLGLVAGPEGPASVYLYGYNLIPLIRRYFPDAIIILHTSEYNHPDVIGNQVYQKECAGIVDKKVWREISLIIEKAAAEKAERQPSA